jgi:hypothetical protein
MPDRSNFALVGSAENTPHRRPLVWKNCVQPFQAEFGQPQWRAIIGDCPIQRFRPEPNF